MLAYCHDEHSSMNILLRIQMLFVQENVFANAVLKNSGHLVSTSNDINFRTIINLITNRPIAL